MNRSFAYRRQNVFVNVIGFCPNQAYNLSLVTSYYNRQWGNAANLHIF
jgi:hypothetical protein